MKKSPVNKKTFKIAYCAVVAAISTAMMMLTSFIPVGTYAIPIFAGALFVSVVVEYNCKWALGIYVVVSILSALLAGDKEAVVFFIALFGYYPILKNILERKIKNMILQWALKLAVFNAAAVAAFFFAGFVLGITAEEYTVFGVYVPYLFLILGNIIFLFYDKALSVIVVFYVRAISPKIFRGGKM